MYELAWARDDRPVVPDQDPRQVSHEITFARNQTNLGVLKGVLLGLCEQVAARLRRHQFQGRIVTVKLRFSDFKTITRRTTLGRFTEDSLAVYESAEQLLAEARTASPLSVRLIGVAVSDLRTPAQIPLSLFETPASEARASKLNDALDRIHSRFGGQSLRRAGSLKGDDSPGTESSVNVKEPP
jgi:DNA polymerase-4